LGNYYHYYYISSDYNTKKYFCQITKESIEYITSSQEREREDRKKQHSFFLSNYPTKVYTNMDSCINPKK